MRLEIIAESETPVVGRTRLERGEMTIGRDPSCTLVIADESRLVSKVHCRILRDARGFLLKDESVNGVSLRGRELAGGEAVRLSDGDAIDLCGHSLRVRIGGDEEPDFSDPDARLALGDDAVSITAILADVAPKGRSASGVLPGRLGEDWMDEPAVTAAEGKERLSRAEIGWRGPPPVSVLEGGLPEDWDKATEAGSRNEHVPATGIRMRLPKTAATASERAAPVRPDATDDVLLDAFLQGYGARLEPAGDPRLFMRRMGRALRDLAELGTRISAHTRDFATGEGVDWPVVEIDPLDPRAGMEAAEADHRRLLEAFRSLLDEVDRLAPAAIEARAAPSGHERASLKERIRETATLLREGGPAWRGYRDAYGVQGMTPRRRFAARLAADDAAEDFEELDADQVQSGAAG